MEKLNSTEFFLVDTSALPEVFMKVIEVKKQMTIHPDMSIYDATMQVGVSRSAFYKYKDKVFPFHESTRGKVVTLYFVVDDFSGILAAIIDKIAKACANILTINQNIPINALADVTISVETEGMVQNMSGLLDAIRGVNGVRRAEILARE